jgi:hypothetical protein
VNKLFWHVWVYTFHRRNSCNSFPFHVQTADCDQMIFIIALKLITIPSWRRRRECRHARRPMLPNFRFVWSGCLRHVQGQCDLERGGRIEDAVAAAGRCVFGDKCDSDKI